ASFAGVNPFASIAVNSKRSIGSRDQAAFFGVGTVGFLTGCKLHHWRRSRTISSHDFAVLMVGALSRGSGAPIFTQASRSAITAAGSFPFLGIFVSGSV